MYSTAHGKQEAKLWILRQRRVLTALVGVAVTCTVKRTGEIAEILIITQRTLAPAVTDMLRMHTDSGSETAVETRAVRIFALKFVLVTRAVIEGIAAHIHGQAVAII